MDTRSPAALVLTEMPLTFQKRVEVLSNSS